MLLCVVVAMTTFCLVSPVLGVGEPDLLKAVSNNLDNILGDHINTWKTNGVLTVEGALEMQKYDATDRRIKRSNFPVLKKKKKKLRTCQNMSGIVGGSNAFNFLSFVVGVITLVVNVNNNINNNNNNQNDINLNADNSNNANANVNNNAANVVIAMPGRSVYWHEG